MVKPGRILVVILLSLVVLVSIVSAASDYCDPPENLTTVVDNNGGWWNITITSDYCYTCEDTGYGNIECSPCDNDPPASVTNISSKIECDTIEWSWDTPADPDFNHTMIYKNDIFLYNVSNTTNTDEWNGLAESTSYTISTHTCDLTGNCNTTWVNLTESTTACVDVPVAGFSADNTTICEYGSVQFTDESTGAPNN